MSLTYKQNFLDKISTGHIFKIQKINETEICFCSVESVFYVYDIVKKTKNLEYKLANSCWAI